MSRVRFEVSVPGARSVFLAGDFNGWDAEAVRMKRVSKDDDLFVRVVDLAPGRYEFKYVADGEWLCCPQSDSVANDHGTHNSVIEVADQ